MDDNKTFRVPHTLIVDISSNFGGANARVLALMKGFPKNRIGLATIYGSIIADELEKLGYSVHRLASSKFDPRIPFRMARVIREFNYDVVDTQNPQSKLWGSLAAWLGKVSLVSTLNSWYMNEHPKYSLRWFVYSAMEFITNFSLSRYIVVSREIQNAMVGMGIPKEKIDLIYNAVDLDAASIKGNKGDLTEKYGVPKDAVVCLAAGRLAWAKAHDDLIYAVAKARKENEHLYCWIAGEGELQEKLHEQISHLQLQKFVLLLGHLEHQELLSHLKASDIYVMPSRSEGTPVALLEAAALGKPIVASNIGGIPELVTNEIHALLTEPGDVDALSLALLKIAGDAKLANRLGEQARTWVEAHFTLAAQVRATAESYINACPYS